MKGGGEGIAMMMQQASTVSHIVRTLCSALCLHLAACVANHLSLLRSAGSEVGQSTLLSPPALSLPGQELVHTDAAQGIAMLWNDLWTQLNGILIKDIILYV